MKIEINIEKKHLYVISALLVLVVAAVGAFAAVSNPKVFHEFLPVKHIQAISPDTKVTVDDGLTVQGNLEVNNPTTINNDLAVNGQVVANSFVGDGSGLTNLPPISGNALDAADGDPVDAVYVDNAGRLHVAGDTRINGVLSVTNVQIDGVLDVTNKVPLYLMSAGCGADDALTTTPSCSSVVCGYDTNWERDIYYSCTGGCNSLSSPQSCNNGAIVGYMLPP